MEVKNNHSVLTSEVSCPQHGEYANVVEDSHTGDMICSECGLVLADRVIDPHAEWRSFYNDGSSNAFGSGDPTRVGPAEDPLMDGKDLFTKIGPGYKNYTAVYRNFFYSSHLSTADRNTMRSFKDIAEMAEKLNAPEPVAYRAKELFKEVRKNAFVKKKNLEAVASACLYIALRQTGCPRTFKEVTAVSGVSKTILGNMYKKIMEHNVVDRAVVKPEDFINRFCSKLSLYGVVSNLASEVARRTDVLELLDGKSPVSIAAAAIYLANQACYEVNKIATVSSPAEIAEVTGASSVVVIQTYRELYKHVAQVLPEEYHLATYSLSAH